MRCWNNKGKCWPFYDMLDHLRSMLTLLWDVGSIKENVDRSMRCWTTWGTCWPFFEMLYTNKGKCWPFYDISWNAYVSISLSYKSDLIALSIHKYFTKDFFKVKLWQLTTFPQIITVNVLLTRIRGYQMLHASAKNGITDYSLVWICLRNIC